MRHINAFICKQEAVYHFSVCRAKYNFSFAAPSVFLRYTYIFSTIILTNTRLIFNIKLCHVKSRVKARHILHTD